MVSTVSTMVATGYDVVEVEAGQRHSASAAKWADILGRRPDKRPLPHRGTPAAETEHGGVHG